MATTPDAEEARTVASHTLAYLRLLDRKLDLVIETLQRNGRTPGWRGTRHRGDATRSRAVKGDIALLENKVVTAQIEILAVVCRP